MDILLTLILGVLAVCVALGKPIQITITHKYDNPPLPPPELSPEEKVSKQNEENSDAVKSMDAVVSRLNEIIYGRDIIAEDDKRT